MPAIVFATAGGKYHFDRGCNLLRTGQDMSDWACWDDGYCRHNHPKPTLVRRMSDTKARLDGKQPCLKCVPEHLRTFDSLGETFGHEPIDISFDGEPEHLVCARCEIVHKRVRRTVGDIVLNAALSDFVRWPCTSAVILGLATR